MPDKTNHDLRRLSAPGARRQPLLPPNRHNVRRQCYVFLYALRAGRDDLQKVHARINTLGGSLAPIVTLAVLVTVFAPPGTLQMVSAVIGAVAAVVAYGQYVYFSHLGLYRPEIMNVHIDRLTCKYALLNQLHQLGRLERQAALDIVRDEAIKVVNDVRAVYSFSVDYCEAQTESERKAAIRRLWIPFL